ncbi:MAG: hypothetical protein ACRELY_20040 [Polyangiaceae bacterium]
MSNPSVQHGPAFDSEWLALPLSARGLVEELAKVVDDAGSLSACLVDGADARVVGNELARLLCAHRSEYVRVRRDAACLLERGFIVLEGSRICRRASRRAPESAVEAAPRTGSAERMRRHRERHQASRGDVRSS